jgi:hypothetical protein
LYFGSPFPSREYFAFFEECEENLETELRRVERKIEKIRSSKTYLYKKINLRYNWSEPLKLDTEEGRRKGMKVELKLPSPTYIHKDGRVELKCKVDGEDHRIFMFMSDFMDC